MALPPPAAGSIAIVTGASSGLGTEMARELAKRGHAVGLVARREDRLRTLAAELSSAHGVRAEVYPCDLTDAPARERLVAAVAADGLDVEILVNNAGFSTSGPFADTDTGREIDLVRTNVESYVALSSEWVPGMVARGRGGILNVASTAAFQPLPHQATYAASKAFVLYFSDALHAELRGAGVAVTSLCPGPVKTEFAENAGLEGEAESVPGFMWTSAEMVGAAAISGLDKGKRVVIPGVQNRAGAFFGQISPRSVLLPIMNRVHPARR